MEWTDCSLVFLSHVPHDLRDVSWKQVAWGGLQAKDHKAGGPGLYVNKRLELSTPELNKVDDIIHLGSQVNKGHI